MKKSLMATTALVAASVAVSGAHAQDDEMMEEEMMAQPISLGISGAVKMGVHFSSYTEESLGMAHSAEIHFGGSTVLDNGLEISVNIELEGEQQGGASVTQGDPTVTRSRDTVNIQRHVDHDDDASTDPVLEIVRDENNDPVLDDDGNQIPVYTEVLSDYEYDYEAGEVTGSDNSDQIDEAYVRITGSFGQIQIGNDDPASVRLATTAPYATFIYGANTPFWAGSISSAGWHSTIPADGDSVSLMYFTPAINGFQLGVSYAPEKGEEARNAVGSNSKDGDVAAVAANYSGSVGETTSITVSGGLVSNGQTAAGQDITDMGVGLQLSRGSYAVGAAYRSVDDGTAENNITYEIGAKYGSGPWAISLNWLHNEDDDAGADNDLYRVLGSYDLGAGVSLAGGVGLDKAEGKDDTRLAGMAIAIGF